MEGLDPTANAQDIDGKPFLSSLSYVQSDVHDSASICLSCEETAKLKQQEIPHESSFGESNGNIAQEDETSEFLCPDFIGKSSISTVKSLENEKQVAEVLKDGWELTHSILKKQYGLTRCATFPCPKEVDPIVSSEACSESASSLVIEKECNSSSDIGYARSVSLPSSFKLISALKGSRAKNGASPNATLSVKWAPDVYDPPVTLLSHTVKKGYNQRPKAKKANKHNKHSRGKSSRGNSSGRRNGSHSSTGNVVEPVNQRLLIVEDKLLPDGYRKSEVDTLDFVSNQDAKCGSSFLREALAKVHISIGEAL